eukprot:9501468-Pyramimonas_sp.AAC.1
MDGSCQRHSIKELSRASWGFTAHADDGSKLFSAFGPIWAPLPQTSQAGEHGALEASSQCLVGPST